MNLYRDNMTNNVVNEGLAIWMSGVKSIGRTSCLTDFQYLVYLVWSSRNECKKCLPIHLCRQSWKLKALSAQGTIGGMLTYLWSS